MPKWLLWILTVVLLLIAGVFFMWAIQTAWLGSFPNKDKAKYSTWATLQLGGAVVFALIPVVLWVRRWWKEESKNKSIATK